jgi:hypothetical protein
MVWLMVLPEPALAPVVPVELATVHANVEGMEADNGWLLVVPLHMADVTSTPAGFGLTVTVIVSRSPVQKPVVDVGVTMYSTVPALVFEGFVSV